MIRKKNVYNASILFLHCKKKHSLTPLRLILFRRLVFKLRHPIIEVHDENERKTYIYIVCSIRQNAIESSTSCCMIKQSLDHAQYVILQREYAYITCITTSRSGTFSSTQLAIEYESCVCFGEHIDQLNTLCSFSFLR